ncbi:MAG: ROK family transcriptional regulator [Bacteroidales bacterium]|nr:ROK family transcriptional regulator [Bacteroidales bacterium]
MTTFLNDTNSKNASIKRDILRHCIKKDCFSISDLSKELNISVPTITKLVGELKDDGFVKDEGKLGTSGGRRPSIYGLDPDAGYFLGIDVARHHFHIAVTNFKGELIHFIQDIEFVLQANQESFQSMGRLIKDEVTRIGVPWIKVLGCGISLSGRVNPEKGYSLTYFVSDDIPLTEQFQKELHVPVTIENDSRAMTYGEYMSLGKEADKNMIFINLGWGLGMGMILDGELYYGKSGFSGEIGHFPLLSNDIICRCGKVGCLETGASGSALHRMIVDKLKQGRKSSLSKSFEKKGEIELEEILQAIREEDVLAIEGIGEIGETLGRGIAGIINIFNPGLVVVGGRLIVGNDYLMLPIRTAVNKLSLSRVSSDTKIKLSTLDRKAAGIGNCLLSRSKLLGLM